MTGTPVTIQEAGRLISSAFLEAGVIAVVAITLLLAIVLRRVRDVALVIAPLLLAALLTLAITVVIGKPLNYANIIALPLLFGIGVAFDIYFVMNWRAGTDESPAVEHGARRRVQRADDDGGLRKPGAVARSEHGADGHAADHLAYRSAVLRPVRAAGVAWPGPAGSRAAGRRRIAASNRRNAPTRPARRWSIGDGRRNCPRDAPAAVVEPERPEACNPPSRARHGIARDARIVAGIRNRPFGERPSPAAREPRR